MKRYLWGLLAAYAAYWVLFYLLYAQSHPVGRWHEGLLLVFLAFGLAFYAVYTWVRRNAPEQALWVIMGSKVVRLLMAIVLLVLARLLTAIPLVPFSIDLIGIYLFSLVYEIIFFSKQVKR